MTGWGEGGGLGGFYKFVIFCKCQIKSDSYLPQKIVLFTSMKALQNDEKCFLFYVKNSFLSQGI